MKLYWPMGVREDGEVQYTYDSSLSEEEYSNCFRVWETPEPEGYGMKFLAKWVDISEGDDKSRIYLKRFKPSKIYFDMDGVLVDFQGGVKELLGIEPRPQGFHPDYDNKLFDAIREYDHFYRELKPIKGSLELLKRVIDKWGVNNVEVLTGGPKASRNIPTASEDKMAWIDVNVGIEGLKVNTVLRKEKVQFVKNKSSVLIDDYDSNIKEWREAGGTGILFGDYMNPAEKILKYLEVI